MRTRASTPCGWWRYECPIPARDGPLPDRWQPLYPAANRRDFGATLPTPAGGWYKLEVRALRDKKVVAETAVDHVGVGEVFVIAGQSNAANSGEEPMRIVAVFRPAGSPAAAFYPDGTPAYQSNQDPLQRRS